MRNTRKLVKTLVCRAWRGLREWCGDAAYDNYLRAGVRRDDGRRLLTAEEFYVERINRKYSQPNRCC